jgi:hypothetical protein
MKIIKTPPLRGEVRVRESLLSICLAPAKLKGESFLPLPCFIIENPPPSLGFGPTTERLTATRSITELHLSAQDLRSGCRQSLSSAAG